MKKRNELLLSALASCIITFLLLSTFCVYKRFYRIGVFDSLMFSNRALTKAEVKSLYELQSSTSCYIVTEDELVEFSSDGDVYNPDVPYSALSTPKVFTESYMTSIDKEEEK